MRKWEICIIIFHLKLITLGSERVYWFDRFPWFSLQFQADHTLQFPKRPTEKSSSNGPPLITAKSNIGLSPTRKLDLKPRPTAPQNWMRLPRCTCSRICSRARATCSRYCNAQTPRKYVFDVTSVGQRKYVFDATSVGQCSSPWTCKLRERRGKISSRVQALFSLYTIYVVPNALNLLITVISKYRG